MDFLILPNQLFNYKFLDKKYNIILWEHPHFFIYFNFNKKKLLLHRASMKYYEDYLKKHKFKVKYYTFKDKPKIKKKCLMFDPIDKLDLGIDVIESPNFILTKDDFKEFRSKTDKFFFHSFYNWGKKKKDIIPNIKSKDKDNRLKIPKGLKIPPVPDNNDEKYVKEAIIYVNKNFPKNYGNTDNFLFPISHKYTYKWLDDFIKNKFKDFGKYEDAIDKDNNFLFHSLLSSSINKGLINPLDIIGIITKHKKNIPVNSYEGYIRQLFWREYQRYCYIYINYGKYNYFGNKGKLNKKWYNGTIGIEPIDNCIRNAFNTGYLHHIERLMMVGNFMNLSGISSKEGFRWFMEFSTDSYEWVMYQNVMDMVFGDNLKSEYQSMRRPYISSSNYILKMSNYKKGEWCNEWTKLYHIFLKKHRTKLLPFRYYFRGL